MKDEATDRLIRDPTLLCNWMKWFVVLHHPMKNHRPVFSGKSLVRVFGPWSPFASDTSASFANLLAGTHRFAVRAMDRLGRLLTTGLETADVIKVRPAQVFAARLVRRFYRVGGMSREIGSGIRAEARPDGV